MECKTVWFFLFWFLDFFTSGRGGQLTVLTSCLHRLLGKCWCSMPTYFPRALSPTVPRRNWWVLLSCSFSPKNHVIVLMKPGQLHCTLHHGDEVNIFSVSFVIIWVLLKFEFWLGPKIKTGPEDDMQGLEAVRSPWNYLPHCLCCVI